MKHVRQHVAYWCRRYPAARPHREDITQEAAFAAWLASLTYDGESYGAQFSTYAWHRMNVAVRRYLVDAGVLRRVGGAVAVLEYVAGTYEVVSMDAPQGLPERDDEPGGVEFAARDFEVATPDGPDAPLARKQAWGLLRGGWESRGFNARQAEALAWVEVGATFAEAGKAVGVSRQAVDQVAKRAGVASPLAWRDAA